MNMKRKGLRIAAWFLALVMAMSLVSCGSPSDEGGNPGVSGGGGTGQPSDRGESTLYLNVTADPQGFDVWAGSGRFQLKYLVFETLFVYDYDVVAQPNPNLIESYEVSEDGTGLTITLRDDIYTQNGVKLVPQDVLWSIEMMLGTNSSRFAKIFDLEKSHVIDDHSVFLASKGKWIDFNMDSAVMIYICSQEAYEMGGSDHFYFTGECGTGPYMVESYTEGNEVVFVKNPNYKDRGSDFWGGQNVDRIVCKVISEPSQAIIEYETNGIDFIVDPDLNDLDYLSSLAETNVIVSPLEKNIVIAFNCSENSKLNNQYLRQAIAYAIDNEMICNQALSGRKIPATGVTNPVCNTWDDSMYDREYYNANLDKAKELLTQAGYPNGLDLEICYSSSDGAYYKTIAEIIQNQLGKININLTITPYDNATFSTVTSTPEGWDMKLTNYKIISNPLFHFWNLVNENKTDEPFWGNAEFQALLDETLYTQDQDGINKMIEMYEEECPYYIIGYETTHFVLREGVENVRFKNNNWYFPGDWNYDNADFAYD